MQTLTRPKEAKKTSSDFQSSRRKRFSPLMLVGLVTTILIVLGAGVFLFAQAQLATQAARNEPNPNCTLIVPAQPLTAQGLATPYQFMATNRKNGPCNQANDAQSAFVQAAVVDPATGQISIYNPLVIDNKTQPAIAPVVPELPANAVVGIWFGYNGDTLTLAGANNSLQDGKCVNGRGTPFGQVAFCNAAAFFQAANQAIQAGQLTPPQLGQGKDGLPCPTVRDFFVVDQDQSDNVTTTYLATKDGKIAQMNAANAAALDGAQMLVNGSDNRLVSVALDNTLGCQSWMAPDLANNGQMTTAQPLNELMAAARQAEPVALVPAGDPMVLVNGKQNLNKLNAFRASVGQPTVQNLAEANTKTYCTNLLNVAPARMATDAQFTKRQPSPDAEVANTLFTFMAQRFNVTWGEDGLNCQGLLKQKSPVTVKTNGKGVAVDATINGVNPNTSVDCAVNGQLVAGCAGTTNINGQACNFMFDRNARRVNITCPQQPQQQ